MPDPWTAKGPTQRGSETRDPLDEFLSRLAALGATADEIRDFRDAWDDVDEDDDPADIAAGRARVLSMTDSEISIELEAIRREYREHTDQPLPPAPIDESVEEVMEWVRADPADVVNRAQAALDAEVETDKPRVTLTRQLEAIIADAAAD